MFRSVLIWVIYYVRLNCTTNKIKINVSLCRNSSMIMKEKASDPLFPSVEWFWPLTLCHPSHAAELIAIFSCLSQLTQLPPHGRFLLLNDSLSSLQSLSNPFSTNPLIQRIHRTLHSLHSIGSQITFIWIPGHTGLLNMTPSIRQLNRPPPFQK